MPLNWNEISPGVYQSGQITDKSDWEIIKVESERIGKPIAIIDMQLEREDVPHSWETGYLMFWFPIPDNTFAIRNMSDNPMKTLFKCIGQVAANLYAAGYMLWFHCSLGISRSTTANAVFRMLQFNETMDKALEFIKNARPIVNPNPYFMDILLQIQNEVGEPGILSVSTEQVSDAIKVSDQYRPKISKPVKTKKRKGR
jgi:protein-tyrosine phosphatase